MSNTQENDWNTENSLHLACLSITGTDGFERKKRQVNYSFNFKTNRNSDIENKDLIIKHETEYMAWYTSGCFILRL